MSQGGGRGSETNHRMVGCNQPYLYISNDGERGRVPVVGGGRLLESLVELAYASGGYQSFCFWQWLSRPHRSTP